MQPLRAVDLGVAAAMAALERAGIEAERVDESVFGHARPAGTGPNPARQVSIGAGVPDSSPAFTVNQACASGLKSIILAAQTVALGGADVMLVGGMESMSKHTLTCSPERDGDIGWATIRWSIASIATVSCARYVAT